MSESHKEPEDSSSDRPEHAGPDETRQRQSPIAAGRDIITGRKIRQRMADFIESAERSDVHSQGRRVRASVYLLRLAAQVVRQWARDRCPQQAASLAFQTVLSVVPALAVCLAALRATGMMEAESNFVRFLTENLVPMSSWELADKLLSWSENITFTSLGTVGLITTVLIAFVMWSSLEGTMNHIWRAEKRRSLTQKFIVFYATATVGPLLIAVSLYQMTQFGLAEGAGGHIIGTVAGFAALFLANYFIPTPRVRAGPAAIGALVTAISFEIAKWLFGWYVVDFAFERYSGVYGALAVAPIGLIWIYWSWLTLLLGAEVAHAAQNIRLLERRDRRSPLTLENELMRRVNGPMAARFMVAVCESFLSGKKALSRQAIADRFDLSEDAVERVVHRLVEADLIMEVEGDLAGFLPARSPSEITLAQVMGAFRSNDEAAGSDRLSVLLREMESEQVARTQAITFDQLVDRSHSSAR